MKLSVLMCALESRQDQAQPLRDELRRQVSQCDAEFLAECDNGSMPSGAKRNRLVRRSTGDYFCFVDDDDFVSPEYVASICGACDGRVDVVSLEMLRVDLSAGNMRTHSFSIHHADKKRLSSGRWLMTANHLCAWRRDVGTKVAFPDALGYADDVFWYRPLIASGLVRTETHLDKILYFYCYHPEGTANQSRQSVKATKLWQGGGIECFRHGDNIYLANKPIERSENEAAVEVRDRWGHVVTMDRKILERFATVRV